MIIPTKKFLLSGIYYWISVVESILYIVHGIFTALVKFSSPFSSN